MNSSNVSDVQTPPARSSWRSAIRGNVLMMGLVSLFTDFSSEMMNPLLPLFIAGLVPLGWAPLYVGLMEGVAEATASILKLFSGRISDKLGKRKALVLLGYGISTLARPAMALAMAGWHIVTLKFFDRVGKGIRTSPRDALIGDSVDKSYRGLAFSFHRSMDHAGAVLGPLAAILIALWFTAHLNLPGMTFWKKMDANVRPPEDMMHLLRLLFAVALVPGIAAMTVLFAYVREIVPKAPAPGAARTLEGWQSLPRRFFAFVAIVTVFALGNSSDLFLLVYAWEKFGMGLVQIVILWIVLHISKIVFSLPGGALSDKLGRRPVIIAGWIVYALVYLGMAVASEQWQFWALFIIYGFYYGMTEGAEKALVADFVPSQQRGTAFGAYHGAVGVAALPASLLFGVLWVWLDKIQYGLGPRVAFSVGAGLAALAALLLGILLSTQKQEKERS
jgi:MFS family permease